MPPLLEAFAAAAAKALANATAAAAPVAQTLTGAAAAAAPAAKALANATADAAANGTAKAAAKAASKGLAGISIGWEGWVVVATLAVALVVMGFDAVGPDLVFGALTSVYLVAGIISLKEGSAGFSNTGVLTVMALYMVAEGVSQTGGLDILMNKVLGSASSVFWAQVRMMIPVMVTSAFLNNTPIVALLIPILLSWSRRCNVPVKKLLIPLSFATVLGGTCTLIGTSTNLVVSGLQQEMSKKDPTIPTFSFFTITPYGLPYAAWGMAYILLFSWLLPGHDGAGHTDLTSELEVSDKSSKVANTTVGLSGLGNAVGTSRLVGVRPGGGYQVVAPSEDLVVRPGDVLIVQGSAQDNAAFAAQNGLQVLLFEGGTGEEGSLADNAESPLAQVTVNAKSDIAGATIRDTGFRGRFDAAVIAVKRRNVKQGGRLGDIVLQKGDVLVLALGPKFDSKSEDFTKNFKKLKNLDQAVQREYTTSMRVTGKGAAGLSIQDAGLRGVTGLFLYEIHRASGEVLRAVGPDTVLEEGDILFFAGDLASVSFLMKFSGLEHTQQDQLNKLPAPQVDRELVQAVVSHSSPLIHKTAREVRFRHTYGAALLAVHRHGSNITGDVADVKLQAGDVLVLESGPEFASVFSKSPAFALINQVPNSAPVKRSRMWLALFLVAALVTTQIIEGAADIKILHLWPGSMLVAGLMLATRCLSATNARQSLDWEVYICIAFAFAVSTAMEKTNVALAIAELFAALSRLIGGQTAALTAMYFVTALLSELLTNNAAAAIMFPIAAELAKKLGVDMNLMSVAIMLGGSAGWILPYSYQCNLMVMSAGGYRTKDFAIFGAPFHPWLLVGVILILGAGNRVYIPLIATGVFIALIIILPLIYEKLLPEATKRSVDALGARAANGLRSLFGCGGGGVPAAGSAYEPAPAPLDDAPKYADQRQPAPAPPAAAAPRRRPPPPQEW